MRSEAQKKADKRYKEKKREGQFNTTFPQEELKDINKLLADKGLNKTDLVRIGVKQLKDNTL